MNAKCNASIQTEIFEAPLKVGRFEVGLLPDVLDVALDQEQHDVALSSSVNSVSIISFSADVGVETPKLDALLCKKKNH